MRRPELDANTTLLGILGVGATSALVLITYRYTRRGKLQENGGTAAPLCREHVRQLENVDLLEHAYEPVGKRISEGRQAALLPSEELSLGATDPHIEKVSTGYSENCGSLIRNLAAVVNYFSS